MSAVPEAILAFWFADAPWDVAAAEARQGFWFDASAETDAQIRDRFGAAMDAAARGELDAWLEAPRSALALVILLDQFPRNVWRGTPRAFATDAQALDCARRAIAAGQLDPLTPVEQSFLLLPFEHAESLAAQRECVALFDRIVAQAPLEWVPLLEGYAGYARRHHAVIERFGRFPHRNAILGRESTPDEVAYLAGGGETFTSTAP
jgi:uncharacterized protein (DUF924 family)